jgi:hypothetical protein
MMCNRNYVKVLHKLRRYHPRLFHAIFALKHILELNLTEKTNFVMT